MFHPLAKEFNGEIDNSNIDFFKVTLDLENYSPEDLYVNSKESAFQL